MADLAELVASHIVDVPDFPKPGILFKDLTPLFSDGPAFREVVDGIVAQYGAASFDVVAGIEARGFVIAAAIAYATGVGVVPVRKAGKLPRAVHSSSYELEYGEAVLEVHTDAFRPGERVLVVDDVLATGAPPPPRSTSWSAPGEHSPGSPCCWSCRSCQAGSGWHHARLMPS
ncbi:hypothetical protein Psuf_063210 [Phytohabitans suffuscus]|uniref:adenine phosphoribosyltransferase n=1 Tax=Phytohabitans suffuscus TaxID=624315 RepID=A0A6F8YSU5_9ACTN|nr:hypothetical protein Psuf_063210 [Phytohabitans suffuscus]